MGLEFKGERKWCEMKKRVSDGLKRKAKTKTRTRT